MPEYLKVTVTAESASGQISTWTIPRCEGFGLDATYEPQGVWPQTGFSRPRLKQMRFSMQPLADSEGGDLYQQTSTSPPSDPTAAYAQAVADAHASAVEHARRVEDAKFRLEAHRKESEAP